MRIKNQIRCLFRIAVLLFALMLNACGGGGHDFQSSTVDSENGAWSSVQSGSPVSENHTAIWTGSAMIVWGDSRVNSGGQYNPNTSAWNNISSADAPEARTSHTAVWTGTEMIVWGGIRLNTNSAASGTINPVTVTWNTAAAVNEPFSRKYCASGISINIDMDIIGWEVSSYVNLSTGGRFNPVTDTWRTTSTVNAPFGRRNHVALWTGTEMIVWGGYYTDGVTVWSTNTGARYNPITDTWVSISIVNAPSADTYRAVWTGNEMIVWSGSEGGRYNPSTDTWQPVSVVNAPSPRAGFSVIWTGTEMIIWGGWTGVGDLVTDTGGRYNPSINSWSPISQSGAAAARYRHTAVWTGAEMIIWGGLNGSTPSAVPDGKKYNPQTDSWATISSVNQPSARSFHTAVWTGTEMIIWGGWNAGTGLATSDGGRYVP